MAGKAAASGFDGIICIGGEDWWYHNRGHFDFQIMRRLARRQPVLFVNSLGVRFPSLGHGSGVFLARLARKLKSLGRGLVHVEGQFHVFSPFTVPGQMGQLASGWALGPQIRLAAQRLGIRRPLLWLHCPAGAGLIGAFRPVATVMQRTDRFEAFPEGDPGLLARQVAAMKAAADLVVYCNEDLMAEEAGAVRRQLLVTHGVDFARFAEAGSRPGPEPADLADIARPRIGFVGGLDAHTFDPGLFTALAALRPDLSFVLVGGSSLPEGWCPHPNVHLLGRKPYDEVPAYMAACDVLTMFWNRSDWIKGCNPIKLKEYLAVGRPVVTTDFPALAPFRHAVGVAGTPEELSRALDRALAAPPPAALLRDLVRAETWDAKADLIQTSLEALAAGQASAQPGRLAA